MNHIHLDPIGGIAGDMFVGALMDLHPEHAAGAIGAVGLCGLDETVTVKHEAHHDGVLSGSRFQVAGPVNESDHEHVHWSALKRRLEASQLELPVKNRAIRIFSHLASAEARVHDRPIESVAFHEVGAWDSIADIVAAAYLIEALGPCSWSIGRIPLGSGRVNTAHGVLPVPAPATVLLLEGYTCFDDGIPGERVTPTGAAILRELDPTTGIGPLARTLGNAGFGFGTRTFEGMSNVLRMLEFALATTSRHTDRVMAVEFEVDDQTPEDLAIALDHIRHTSGVLDASQTPCFGKQGRLATRIQILTEPQAHGDVIDVVFSETTTIGLRVHEVDRVILQRNPMKSSDGINVKLVERASGPTAKAEIRDVATIDSHDERKNQRTTAEQEVLSKKNDD